MQTVKPKSYKFHYHRDTRINACQSPVVSPKLVTVNSREAVFLDNQKTKVSVEQAKIFEQTARMAFKNCSPSSYIKTSVLKQSVSPPIKRFKDSQNTTMQKTPVDQSKNRKSYEESESRKREETRLRRMTSMFCKCGLDDHVYSVYEEEIRKLKEENTELLLKLCRNEGPIKQFIPLYEIQGRNRIIQTLDQTQKLDKDKTHRSPRRKEWSPALIERKRKDLQAANKHLTRQINEANEKLKSYTLLLGTLSQQLEKEKARKERPQAWHFSKLANFEYRSTKQIANQNIQTDTAEQLVTLCDSFQQQASDIQKVESFSTMSVTYEQEYRDVLRLFGIQLADKNYHVNLLREIINNRMLFADMRKMVKEASKRQDDNAELELKVEDLVKENTELKAKQLETDKQKECLQHKTVQLTKQNQYLQQTNSELTFKTSQLQNRLRFLEMSIFEQQQLNLQLRNEYFQMRNTSMELFTDCKRLKESLDQHLVLLSEANEEIMKLNIEKMVCQKGLSKSL